MTPFAKKNGPTSSVLEIYSYWPLCRLKRNREDQENGKIFFYFIIFFSANCSANCLALDAETKNKCCCLSRSQFCETVWADFLQTNKCELSRQKLKHHWWCGVQVKVQVTKMSSQNRRTDMELERVCAVSSLDVILALRLGFILRETQLPSRDSPRVSDIEAVFAIFYSYQLSDLSEAKYKKKEKFNLLIPEGFSLWLILE